MKLPPYRLSFFTLVFLFTQFIAFSMRENSVNTQSDVQDGVNPCMVVKSLLSNVLGLVTHILFDFDNGISYRDVLH